MADTEILTTSFRTRSKTGEARGMRADKLVGELARADNANESNFLKDMIKKREPHVIYVLFSSTA